MVPIKMLLSPFSKVYSSLSIYHQAAVTTMNQPPWAPLLPWTRLPPDRGKYSSTAGRISRPSLPCGRRLAPTAVIFSTISAYLGQSPIDWTASSNRPPRGNWLHSPNNDASLITTFITPLSTTLQYTTGYVPQNAPCPKPYGFLRSSPPKKPSAHANPTPNHHVGTTLYRAPNYTASTASFATTMSANNANNAAASGANANAFIASLQGLAQEDRAAFLSAITAALSTNPNPPSPPTMPSPTANGADVGTLTNPSGQHGLLALQQTDQQTNLDDFNLQTRHLSKDLTLGEMVRRPHVTFHFNLTPKAQGNPISLARIKQNIDEMLSSNLPGLPTDILDCAQLTTSNREKSPIRGFCVISPKSCTNHKDPSFIFPESDIHKLTTFVASLCNVRPQGNILHLPPYVSDGSVTFFMDPVNSSSQSMLGVLTGVDAQLVLSKNQPPNPLTLRHLATDIYKATALMITNKGEPLPSSLQCDNHHTITSAMSVKPLRLPQKNTTILAVVFASNCSPLAADMARAFQDDTTGLSSIPLMETPPSGVSCHSSTLRASYVDIEPKKDNSKLLAQVATTTVDAMKAYTVVSNVLLSSVINLDYGILGHICAKLPHCVAIIPNFHNLHTSPTFTAVFIQNFDTSQYSPDTVTANICAIPAFATYHPIPTNPPTPSTSNSSYQQAAVSSPPPSGQTNSALRRLAQSNKVGNTQRRYYAVVNGKGGGASIGVFFTTWDDIRRCIDGVSHSRCQKFPNYTAAMEFLQTFYPSIKSDADAQEWRNNTPVDETNTTNRSPIVQRDIIRHHVHSNLKSYPFAPPDAPNHQQRLASPLTTTTRKRSSPSTVPRPSPSTANPHLPSPNPSTPPRTILTSPPAANHHDDVMSHISSQTNQLQLSPTKKKGRTAPQPANPSLTTIQTTISITVSNSEAVDQLQILLCDSEWATYTPETVYIAAILANPNSKSVYFIYNSATIAFNIFTELIATPTAVSQAFTLTTPPQEPSALDLSTLHPPSPTENATIPSRCPCKSCELSILPTFTTAADYIKHINTFHSDFFQLLNANLRLSYSIAMCVGCNLLLPPDELTNHLQTCQHHRLSQASATSTSASTTGQPSTPPTTPADESTIAILAGFCPDARKADFEALLPHASNEELTQAVQGWVSASTNNSHP